MPLVPASVVRVHIASGQPAAVYLLQGDDDIEKSALASEFAGLVEADLRAFNVERLHAGDWTTGDSLANGVSALADAVRTRPLMAKRRVVTVAQAEHVLTPKRESEAAARALVQLETLVKDLVKEARPEATLVFVAGPLDRRSRMYKLLLKDASIVECGVVVDQADAERWIRTRVAAAGVEIEPQAARLMADLAGPDVRRLRGEVDRLLLYALGQTRIRVEDVRELAGPRVLQDEWAMTQAIEAGQSGEALRQLALMLDTGAAPEKILGQLGWLVRTKLSANVSVDLPAAVQAVLRTDLDLKRSAGAPRVLLERLVVELSARGRPRPAGPRRF